MKNLVLGLIYLSYAFKITDADIRPEDKTYEVEQNKPFTIEWVYDNQTSMLIVTWTFKNSTAQTADTVMTQLNGAVAQLEAGIDNIEHEQNGTITLKSVRPKDIGTYKCIVTYSGLSPVTGTATIKFKATTGGNTGGLSTGAKAGIGSAVVVVVGIGVTIAVVILKKMGKLPGKGDKGDTSRDVESTRSSPEKAKNKLLNEKKQVHPDSEGKKPFRPQPSPPPEANINHSSNPDKHKTGHVSAGSGLPAIQGADNGPSLTKKTDPLPPIGGTPRTDKTY